MGWSIGVSISGLVSIMDVCKKKKRRAYLDRKIVSPSPWTRLGQQSFRTCRLGKRLGATFWTYYVLTGTVETFTGRDIEHIPINR